ncbi:MAG: hypothetical protein AB1592_12895 [Pseudomonadota bacterium]
MVDDQGSGHMSRPRFVWALDFGQVLQLGAFVVPLVGTLWWFAAQQTALGSDVIGLKTQASTVIAQVAAITQSDIRQDERIRTLAEAAADSRRINSEVLAVMNAMREDIAAIKARQPKP